jgi:hypothetical protein
MLPWVPTGPEIEIGCAGENQQQFTRPIDRLSFGYVNISDVFQPSLFHFREIITVYILFVAYIRTLTLSNVLLHMFHQIAEKYV